MLSGEQLGDCKCFCFRWSPHPTNDKDQRHNPIVLTLRGHIFLLESTIMSDHHPHRLFDMPTGRIIADITSIRNLDDDFKVFSTAHSWYKHVPMPTTMRLSPYWTTDEETHVMTFQGWTAYYPEDVSNRLQRMKHAPPALLKTIQANEIEINGLVSIGGHGIHLTIGKGGTEWLEWLRKMGYDAEANFIENTKKSDDDIDDEHPIIVSLRAKEYERMRQEFVSKVKEIQSMLSAVN